MNLLLLLSAMLSALTGVGGSARVREAPAVAARVVGEVAKATAAPVRRHPLPVLPSRAVLPMTPLVTLALVAAEPIYAGRRRE